jgi:hypothetical protein
MKKLIIPILSGLVISCSNLKAQDTKFQEKINKQFIVSPNSVLAVYNIDGFIKVEGYDGNKVMIEVDKTLSGKTNEILEQGKREFKFEFEQKGDSLIAYIAEPWDSRPNRNHEKRNDDHRKIEYRHNLNFTIKVPNSINLTVSTINNGDITVANVYSFMNVHNVNGAVLVKNAKNANEIHTINGDVNINYIALPPNNAKFYTLNGKLTATFPNNLSADCEFKSFNGELFTDFENIEKLPSKITKITKENDGGTTHKLSKGSAIRIGNGGKNLKFETFNGNIYIKKDNSKI